MFLCDKHADDFKNVFLNGVNQCKLYLVHYFSYYFETEQVQ